MRKRGTMNNDLKTEEMCKNWLIQQKAKIKKSTYANYCYLIRKLIEPKLGEIDVMKLKKAYLEQLVLDLQEREYADSTIYSALRVLKTILRKHAVQNDNYEEMIHHCYLTVHRLESKVLLEDESACIKEYLLQKNDTYALGILLCRSTGIRIGDDDDKIRLNQRKPSKYKGLSRFGPEKNLQRINKFMKERPTFYKKLIQMKENFRFYLRCFYCITKVVILQFNSEKQDRISS